MEDLIILGAGGSSQQIIDAIADVNSRKPTWNVVGYLDDNPAKHGQIINGVKVLGSLSSVSQFLGRVLIGMASPKEPARRCRVYGEMGLPLDRFATVIHPSAFVAPASRIGAGSAVLQNVVITQNTSLGNHIIVLHNASIGHDVIIEDFVTIAAGAAITGLARVRQSSYIGANSSVNNGVTVNHAALVGLGAVVVKDVLAGMTVVGNPARPVAPNAH
jgi:sugar O-acyltransferase (sialic acid O-acetyltransferase NeuD family)